MKELPIPQEGYLNSAYIESNLFDDHGRTIVSSLTVYGRAWTTSAPEPLTDTGLRILMHMQQRNLLKKFWRYIGAA